MHTLISESFITEILSTFKNTSGLAYSFNDLKEWSSQTIHSNDSWIVLSLTTPEGETKYMYYSDFKKALEDGTLQLNANSGALKYEGISQKDWTERILSSLSAEYADGGIQSQEPLKTSQTKRKRGLHRCGKYAHSDP